jgi:pSer/pThr/pTyr-binding forkhead associated (FHA) protein
MWMLRTLDEGSPEKVFRLVAGGIRTVGRASGADFIVDAALVSRVHCRLTSLPDGGLEVRDLESTNGTYVNGTRVDSARLSHGDRLQVGRLELMVERDAAHTAQTDGNTVHAGKAAGTAVDSPTRTAGDDVAVARDTTAGRS